MKIQKIFSSYDGEKLYQVLMSNKELVSLYQKMEETQDPLDYKKYADRLWEEKTYPKKKTSLRKKIKKVESGIISNEINRDKRTRDLSKKLIKGEIGLKEWGRETIGNHKNSSSKNLKTLRGLD